MFRFWSCGIVLAFLLALGGTNWAIAGEEAPAPAEGQLYVKALCKDKELVEQLMYMAADRNPLYGALYTEAMNQGWCVEFAYLYPATSEEKISSYLGWELAKVTVGDWITGYSMAPITPAQAAPEPIQGQEI